jgi:hypothetical protein
MRKRSSFGLITALFLLVFTTSTFAQQPFNKDLGWRRRDFRGQRSALSG